MNRFQDGQPTIHQPTDDPSARTPGGEEVEAPPRASLPITPFGDAKPYAGSVLDPTRPAADEHDGRSPAADAADGVE